MAVEGTTVQLEGFDELQKKLTITLPKTIRDMAFTTDAASAAFARKIEDEQVSRLEMGQTQQKPYYDEKGKAIKAKGYRPKKVYTKWSSTSGWVSTSRMVKKGPKKKLVPMSMGHFSWAEGTKYRKGSVVAHYSNKLANLWGHNSKRYENRSPLVGDPDHPSHWKVGQIRYAMFDWSKTAGIINSMEKAAIAKTEAQFADEFKRI